MKEIYFACSIRGGRDDAETYRHIVEHTKTKAIVLSEIFASGTLTPDGMQAPSRDIHDKDMAWVEQSDAIIAEVTNPSLGVGYELGRAVDMNKPVLALFRDTSDRKLSAMIEGSPTIQVVYYQELEVAYAAINSFIDSL